MANPSLLNINVNLEESNLMTPESGALELGCGRISNLQK